MTKPILCVDFDGVIHSYASGWSAADKISDPPVAGAMDFLMRAARDFNVNIYSSRSHQPGGIAAMRTWTVDWLMKDLGWKYDRATDFVYGELKWPEHKPSARVTLDDRAIPFEGTWPSIKELLEFQPWNKRNPDAQR
jgi:hypothetical protein